MSNREDSPVVWQTLATGQLLNSPSGSLEEVAIGPTPTKPLMTPACSDHRYANLSHGSEYGGICRICHEGDGKERLISPCKCSGTMGLIHRSCLETWLCMQGATQCELCGYQLTIRKEPKQFLEWLTDPSSPQDRKNIKADLICFAMLTPLACVSCWLCISGAVHYVTDKDHNQWEAIGLVILTIFLMFIYFLWCLIAVRYHYRVWHDWRQNNQNIFLELSMLPASPNTTDLNNNTIIPITDPSASAVQHSSASISSRDQDDSQTGQCQCRRMILSSTPRFRRLSNKSVHICYCGYVLRGSCQSSEAAVCEINVMRGMCRCSGRSSRTRRERLYGHDYAPVMSFPDENARAEVFGQARDPIGCDPWRDEVADRCELVPHTGARQRVYHSSNSDTSPNRSAVAFNVNEDLSDSPWTVRSSTPMKDENQNQACRGRKVKYNVSGEAEILPSCTDALLNDNRD